MGRGGGGGVETLRATVSTGKDFFLLLCEKALKNDVTLFRRMPRGRSHGVSSLQPKAWQGWDLEYACDPISRPGKPVSQEPRQLTSLHRLRVPPPAFTSALSVCVFLFFFPQIDA